MNNLEYLDNCKSKFHNSYEAVNDISIKSRKLLKDFDYNISVSSAISHILKGTRPTDRKQNVITFSDSYEDEFLILDTVSDRYVVDSVKYTIKKYLDTDLLVYYYHKDIDECNKSRVRVLSNMIVSEIDDSIRN